MDISFVQAADRYGRIGLSTCPGRIRNSSRSGRWYRDLGIDLNDIRRWCAVAVVSLADQRELRALDVGPIGPEAQARHMAWYHVPLPMGATTGWRFEQTWLTIGPVIRFILRQGFLPTGWIRACLRCYGASDEAAHLRRLSRAPLALIRCPTNWPRSRINWRAPSVANARFPPLGLSPCSTGTSSQHWLTRF